MPENGIKFLNRKELLSYEEMLRLINVFGDLGVNKVRITGGEPFVRNGVMDFLTELSQIETLKSGREYMRLISTAFSSNGLNAPQATA